LRTSTGSKMRALTPDDIERQLRRLAAEGYARSTVSTARFVLAMILRHAERRGVVARNVAALVDTPPARETQPRRSLTVAQAEALLRAIQGDRLEALVVTGLMLGLRPGELTGLLWEDVDLQVDRIHVRRALKHERGLLHLGEPKTRRSWRTLDLPSPVVAALRTQRVRQAEERLRAGEGWGGFAWGDIPLVFTTPVGTPIDPSNLRKSFARLTEGAGIGHWTPYELRHLAVSLLSAAGVALEHIADVTGHDSTRMTGQVYRHLITPAVSAGVEPMERLFGGRRP
jgi:integrase